MRLLLVLALLLLPAALTAGEPLPAHGITCSSPRVYRDYSTGLMHYHLGLPDAAIQSFQEAVRRDPGCAMAYWGLSRVLYRQGRSAEALGAANTAASLTGHVDDRERQMIDGWVRRLQAVGQAAEARRRSEGEARQKLDLALTMYPEDPELWVLRAEAAESPLRAAPFLLAALRLDPGHPLARSWKPPVVPAPELQPAPTQPIPPGPQIPPLFEGLGRLSHSITTSNPQARAYYEQGLRCWHSYVTPLRGRNSAGVNFRHAANLDPTCAMAYWGLSFCLGPGDPMKPLDAAHRALELAVRHGTDRERRFAAARVLELGGGQKREEFLSALDAAIAAYPDDVELWIWRGKAHGTQLQAMPYQLAAHRMEPEHPSPNHELVHAYEGIDRPALGWPYTEGYRRSAPNMPHANHMQAHLAMRLGRWQEALDCTRMSRRRSIEGFPELDSSHHVDTMIRALAHEGRFAEAEAETRAYRDGMPWARLLRLKCDETALREWAARRRTANSPDGYYVGALAVLDSGDLSGLAPLMTHVEEQWKKAPGNIYRYNEVRGRYLVQTGEVEAGLKLLREAAARAVKDSGMHAWGGGSYVLEVWGEAALIARRWDEAVEAFHEALAHEHGSIVAALGMQVVAERLGQPERVSHYAGRAAQIWSGADPGSRERMLARLRRFAAWPSPVPAPAVPAAEAPGQPAVQEP